MSEATPFQSLQTLRLIWGVLMMSIILYGVIVFVAIGEPVNAPMGTLLASPPVLLLHLLGMATFLMAFIVDRIVRGSLGAGNPRESQALIVRCAMIEATAIFGLIAAFISRSPNAFLLLGALAIGGMLMSFPRARTAM